MPAADKLLMPFIEKAAGGGQHQRQHQARPPFVWPQAAQSIGRRRIRQDTEDKEQADVRALPENNMHLAYLLFRRLAVENLGDCLREAAAGSRRLLPILGGQEEDGEHPKEGQNTQSDRNNFYFEGFFSTQSRSPLNLKTTPNKIPATFDRPTCYLCSVARILVASDLPNFSTIHLLDEASESSAEF